jgi:hypothetical protein
MAGEAIDIAPSVVTCIESSNIHYFIYSYFFNHMGVAPVFQLVNINGFLTSDEILFKTNSTILNFSAYTTSTTNF